MSEHSNGNDHHNKNGSGHSQPPKRKVAKTTTRPTREQERRANAADRKARRSEQKAARSSAAKNRAAASQSAADRKAQVRRGIQNARKASGKAGTGLRAVGKAFQRTFTPRLLKWAAAVFGVLLIALIVFLFFNVKSERIEDGGYRHQERFSNYLVIDGIDVSFAQGEDIDWKKVKKSGVDFVFIRAGYRGAESGLLNEDSEFAHNVRDAKKAGLMVGVYYYSQAVTAGEAREEAEYVCSLVEPYEIDLPLVIDYEFFPDGRLQKAYASGLLTQKFMNNVVKEFCSVAKENGYDAMVYANYSFLLHTMDAPSLRKEIGIWLAHYAEETDYPDRYDFWQCSNQETVPGIQGEVDRDFWYVDPVDGEAGDPDKLSITDCRTELRKDSFTYIGFPVEPVVVVKYDGKKLTEGRDYRIGYVRNTAPGTGYAIITGIGDYSGMITQSFRIKKLF